MIKFLDLHKQYLSIKDEIDQSIKAVINNSSFIGGSYKDKFEVDFARYLDVNNCIGVANGTDALEIAIEALGPPLNSEIIVPANSYISSAEAVSRSGCKVIFCDVNEDDYLISLNDLKNKITENTFAIMPVHLYGQICDMDEIIKIAKESNIKIIEDTAQAHGAIYNGKKAGTFGDVGCFSFYPGKNLGAYGDAGAIITNNNEIADKARLISNHGRTSKYNHIIKGRNSRLDGLQAAILSVKLKHLDKWIDHRNKLAKQYIKLLTENLHITLPKINELSRHAFHLFIIRCEERDKLQKFLKQNDIETGIHYPIALPDTRAYLNYNQKIDNVSNICSRILSLPIGEHLTEAQIEKVCMSINSFYS